MAITDAAEYLRKKAIDAGNKDLAKKGVPSENRLDQPELGLVLPVDLDFSKNQWTGFLTEKDFDYNGNIITLGAASPEYSQIEAILLLALLNRASKTPEGMKAVFSLIHKYLDSITKVLDGLHMTSAANPYNNLINEYVAQPLYMRLGLISPRDATQNRAWLDHVMKLFTDKSYFETGITGLTTLVNSTRSSEGQYGESASGLGAIAKILGSGT